MSTTKAMRKLFKQREKQMSDAYSQAIKDGEPGIMKIRPTKNTLNAQETFKLCSWIQSNSKEFLNSNTWTMEKIAERASKELGFNVTKFNVRNGFTTVGLPIPRGLSGKKRTKGRLLIIAKSLYILMKNLGNAIPPDLELLVKDLEK